MRTLEKVKVSVLVPCRNEVRHIEACVTHLLDFDPPGGGFEVIVIDGMSDDGTRDVLFELRERHAEVVIVDNPGKTVPHAMNLGICAARGEYIVRADVRCVHPKGYLKDLLALREKTQADNAGGTLVAVGETYVQKSIAAAYGSPIAVGNALGTSCEGIREVDDVYGGCFKKEFLLQIGMYDERFVRNQDDELSFRTRNLGGKIVQSGEIRVLYLPRKRFSQLFKQFFQYGFWKVHVVRKHPGQASFRHFIPSAFVLGMLGLGVGSFFSGPALLGLAVLLFFYFMSLSLEAVRLSRKSDVRLLFGIVFAIFTMHMGYGTGFILSLAGHIFNRKLTWSESLSR